MCIGCVNVQQWEDTRLPSGSIVHWGERDPENVNQVMVTCGRCQQKRMTTAARGKYLKNWTGFCLKCKDNPYNRKTYDEILPSGSIIHWGERDAGSFTRLMVTCGLCKRKRMTIVRRGKRRDAWTGFCKEHQGWAGLSELVSKLSRSQNADLTSINQPKRSRGRQPGKKLLDEKQLLADVKTFIMQVWNESQSVRAITLKAVAAKFHLRGERIGEAGVKRRIERAGFAMAWPAFVESALRERGEL
jgi:hypothetical protein